MLKTELIKELKIKYPDVKIIGVTKYTDYEGVNAFINAGINDIGENRDDSFLKKYDLVEGAIWHFIGSLQTKKVRKVINKIDFLHSLDRLALAEEIQKRALKPVKCFVQVKTTEEETKHGLSKDDLGQFLSDLKQFDKIEVVGLMTMAVESDDIEVLKQSFKTLNDLKEEFGLAELSMGMSGDFETAIEFGATYVRLGRILYK